MMNKQRSVYIYKYTNLINTKIYVGSTFDIKCRDYSHRHASKCKKTRFYDAISVYGWESFCGPEILEVCTQEDRNERENHWIKYYGTLDSRLGYNLQLADVSEISEITRLKQSEAHKGKKLNLSDERRLEISKQFKGRKHTKERIAKRVATRIASGYTHTEQTKKKIAKSNTGKVKSLESRKKQSESTKGKTFTKDVLDKIVAKRRTHKEWHTQETRDKISKANLGKTKTEEDMAKAREGHKRWVEKMKMEKEERRLQNVNRLFGSSLL